MMEKCALYLPLLRELEWSWQEWCCFVKINEAIAETDKEYVSRREGQARGLRWYKGRCQVQPAPSRGTLESLWHESNMKV